MSKFNIRLRELRLMRGLSQQKLAEYATISKSSINMYERGAREPSLDTLEFFADFFNVDMDYLLGKSNMPNKALDSNLEYLNENKLRYIPVYESVSAGFGTAAHNYIVGYEPLYIESDIETQNTLCIKVKGDSMFPKIEDGDIIQVEKTEAVDSGSVAVILLNKTDALVKKIKYGKNWIELHSFNPMYPVLRFDGKDTLQIQILGKVKKIIKKL